MTSFSKQTGINSELPKMCIPNLFKPFSYKKGWKKFGMAKSEILVKQAVSIHITLIQCNGVERNEKFFGKNCQKKIFFVKKKSLKKKTHLNKKKIIRNFLNFQS